MRHLFFVTRLAPVVSEAIADRGRFSVAQGQLETQFVQWLHTDPYWTMLFDSLSDQPALKRMRGKKARLERHSVDTNEEGGYSSHERL